MPRYYFDLADGVSDIDHDGVDLVSDDQARIEAVKYLGALLVDDPELIGRDHPCIVDVRSDQRETLFAIRAEFASPLSPESGR